MYSLGVDLGTVYTAAATWEDGHAEIVSLGSRSTTVPSVVLLRDDDSFLTGEAANRRALIEPLRVAREFKRRFGDVIPIMLGGTPHSPEALMSRLLRSVVAEVTARQGEPPTTLCVCHPANWGAYKTDLLQQAIHMADVHVPVTLAVEPVAAAAYYARQQRIDTGALIAVYDLGGGTFDAAVVRKTGERSFEIVGHPDGIEHLGGSDFDAAVLAHVRTIVGDPLTSLDDEEPAAMAAVSRLRDECMTAKETLSSDTDASIPVLLPGFSTEVRLTRAEFEQMIRPSLYDTISSLQRAVRSAGVQASDLHSVLLIGGSSRIPLVAQLVGAELDRPVAVDAHPKHAVALGAAWLAAGDTSRTVGGTPSVATPPAAAPTSEPAAAEPTAEQVAAAPTAEQVAAAEPTPAPPVVAASQVDPAPTPLVEPTPSTAPAPAPVVPAAEAGAVAPAPDAPSFAPATPAAPTPAAGPAPAPRAVPAAVDIPATDIPPREPAAPARSWLSRHGARAGVAAAGVVLVTTAVMTLVSALGGGNATTDAKVAAPATSAAASTPAAPAAPAAASTQAAVDPLYACPTAAEAPKWACIDSAKFSGGRVTFTTSSNFTPSETQDDDHQHYHVYLANPGAGGTTDPADTSVQTGPNQGTWYNLYSDVSDAYLDQVELGGKRQKLDPADYSLLCIRVANGLHGLALDAKGGFRTGNCVKLG